MEREIASSVLLWLILLFHPLRSIHGNMEGDALHSLRTSLQDPNNVLQSWDPTLVNPCTWFHVTCNIENSVIRVDLGNAALSGQLVPLLGQLRNLQYFCSVKALRHVRQIAQETSGEIVYSLGRQPAVLRTFSQRLSRGFNDAINGFSDDGWSVLGGDGVEDVVIAINSSKNVGNNVTLGSSLQMVGGVLCAKASMLLQNVPPALLVKFLREHRSEWADYSVDAYSAASLKAGSYAMQGLRPTRFSGSQIIMPLAHTVEHEETSDILYYEVLDIPLPELQGLKILKVAFHHVTKDEVSRMRSMT